jgi:hypothetical protein
MDARLSIVVLAPNNGESPSPCLAANIAAVNQVSNLNVNASNVVGQPFIYNGGLNVNFSVHGGSPSQLPVGRYHSSILGRIFGFGSSLHVPEGGADPSTYGVDANGNFYVHYAHRLRLLNMAYANRGHNPLLHRCEGSGCP